MFKYLNVIFGKSSNNDDAADDGADDNDDDEDDDDDEKAQILNLDGKYKLLNRKTWKLPTRNDRTDRMQRKNHQQNTKNDDAVIK